MTGIYKPRQFAALVGRSVNTLQRWDRSGLLKAYRTPSNRRFYTHQQYIELVGHAVIGKKNIAYLRAAANAKSGELKEQREALEGFCIAKGVLVDGWIQDTASSLDYRRKGFNKLMAAIIRQEVARIIVAHQDRLVRFGFDWLQQFCHQHGVQIISLNANRFSPEREVSQDFIRIVAQFAERIPSLRPKRKSLEAIIHKINTDSDILCSKWA